MPLQYLTARVQLVAGKPVQPLPRHREREQLWGIQPLPELDGPAGMPLRIIEVAGSPRTWTRPFSSSSRTDLTTVRSQVDAALTEFPAALVHDQASALDAQNQMLDSMLGLVTVLLVLAVLIALLGITNALALAIVERRREVGMLRAVGSARGQISRMVSMEAVLTAAVGALTGTTLGVLLAAAAIPAGSAVRSAPPTTSAWS